MPCPARRNRLVIGLAAGKYATEGLGEFIQWGLLPPGCRALLEP